MEELHASFIPDHGIGKYFQAARGLGSQISAKSIAFANLLGRAGQSVIPYKRAIGWGTAGAIGIAAVLSQPPQALNLSVPFVKPNIHSGSGGMNVPDNPHPQPPQIGRPTISPMTQANNTARINPTGNHHVRVRSRSGGGVNYNNLSSDLRGVLGGSTRLNTTISDRRTSLSEQKVADILARG